MAFSPSPEFVAGREVECDDVVSDIDRSRVQACELIAICHFRPRHVQNAMLRQARPSSSPR